jgi:hypothetical protein
MTYLIATAVHTKLCRHCHSSAKVEEGVENVKRKWDRGARHDSRESARDQEAE